MGPWAGGLQLACVARRALWASLVLVFLFEYLLTPIFALGSMNAM